MPTPYLSSHTHTHSHTHWVHTLFIYTHTPEHVHTPPTLSRKQKFAYSLLKQNKKYIQSVVSCLSQCVCNKQYICYTGTDALVYIRTPTGNWCRGRSRAPPPFTLHTFPPPSFVLTWDTNCCARLFMVKTLLVQKLMSRAGCWTWWPQERFNKQLLEVFLIGLNKKKKQNQGKW